MGDGLRLMGIKDVTESATLCEVAELVPDRALPECITMLIGWKNIQVGYKQNKLFRHCEGRASSNPSLCA